MNPLFKLFIIFLSFCLTTCKKENKQNTKITSQNQVSDYDVFLKKMPKADYTSICSSRLNFDKINDFYVQEEMEDKTIITFYDGKTKYKMNTYSVKGKVKLKFFPRIDSTKTNNAVFLSVYEKEKESARIIQYSHRTKKIETIFEYPIIIWKSSKITELNYIDFLYPSEKNKREKILVYEGRLLENGYTDVTNIKPKNKKVLKTFLYNREKMIFEEHK